LINKESIQNIIETARIEEVIGDYISLKKRGVNLLGLCPFHTEKTPSFTVSPTKGIYKCFGCGKSGNAVNFLMEHEHLSYPDALRYLAKKYFIEIEEDKEKPSSFQSQAENEKESMMHLTSFAQQFFTKTLLETPEGKAVGLSYFKERGFDEKTIEKFQLGYSPQASDGLTTSAIENGYQIEYLIQTGLSIQKEDRFYDRFRERVIFPIHNISGRVIAFGGRTLSTEKTIPKYVNSPESPIYHKSNVLYGIFFAKSAIIAQNNCYLVEGYTDVISLNMVGIENVVASSGTSLTVEQIRLIRRYTPNITILYDGDAAGIKASFRGIDMILEEGMNVKIVLFPNGEDPDSFARKKRPLEVRDFIKQQASDFITFKTKLLTAETANDPIKKANLIKEIVGSIAIIPDEIIRSVYIRECSAAMKMQELTLINELNKLRRNKSLKKSAEIAEDQEISTETEYFPQENYEIEEDNTKNLENEIISFLLNSGKEKINVGLTDENGQTNEEEIFLAVYIIDELKKDDIRFQDPILQQILDEYEIKIKEGMVPNAKYFINHSNREMSSAIIDIESNNSQHQLANWKKHRITVVKEEDDLIKSMLKKIIKLKLSIVSKMINKIMEDMKKQTTDDELQRSQQEYMKLKNLQKHYAETLSIIVLK